MAVQKIVNVKYKISSGQEYNTLEEAQYREALIEPTNQLRNLLSKIDQRTLYWDMINRPEILDPLLEVLTKSRRITQKYKTPRVKSENKVVSIGSKVPVKQVKAYNEKGELVATYNSTIEAATAMGVAATSIAKAARGVARTSAGHFWAYNDNPPNIRESKQPEHLRKIS